MWANTKKGTGDSLTNIGTWSPSPLKLPCDELQDVRNRAMLHQYLVRFQDICVFMCDADAANPKELEKNVQVPNTTRRVGAQRNVIDDAGLCHPEWCCAAVFTTRTS